ncbi:MAG: hypothetical protein H7A39_02970 [Chlamydiales bacterium]|nr:hypothetical protein [Chlamydiales bacterium]
MLKIIFTCWCFIGFVFGDAYSLTIDGTKRHYEVFTSQTHPGKSPLIVFLHGLQNEDVVFPVEFIQSWKEKIQMHNFVLALPKGIPGVFENDPQAWGWGPKFAEENLAFVTQMIEHIKNHYVIDVDHIILFGYSNGAYFTATLLQQKTNLPIHQFWLQGGGVSETIASQIPRKPVVLQIGTSDKWHYATVDALDQHLKRNGWKEGENLLFEKLESSHDFSFEKFDTAYRFLMSHGAINFPDPGK